MPEPDTSHSHPIVNNYVLGSKKNESKKSHFLNAIEHQQINLHLKLAFTLTDIVYGISLTFKKLYFDILLVIFMRIEK